jgi:ABC-2 type transport system permease protein
MPSQLAAILGAQVRALWNSRLSESRSGRLVGALAGVVWYGMWTSVAVGAGFGAAAMNRRQLLLGVPLGLFVVFCYWQLSPILSVSLGAAMDLKKLLLYPIPTRQLFLTELALRAIAGMEMLLVLAGGTIGLLSNAAMPRWGPLAAIPLFAAFNLLFAAGTRSLLERLMAYKRIREAVVFLFVLAAALPQFLSYSGVPHSVRGFLLHSPLFLWPWSAASRIALGEQALPNALLLAVWIVLAYLFGARQFLRGLNFDFAAREAADRSREYQTSWGQAFYGLPGLFFPDPLAALIEKELRSLIRTPRFRLLFLMGFSFGVLIWLPVVGRGHSSSLLSENFPVLVSAYAIVLLAEAIIWNVFGFDRAAAQLYFSAPVRISHVLAAKNLAALFFIILEITMVMTVCVVFHLLRPGPKILEAYLGAFVLCLYLQSAGNISSIYYPRAVNPEHSWGRASRGTLALFMVLAFPLLALPVVLAFLARYAFGSPAAFYAVLAFDAVAGVIFYRIAMESAVRAVERRKENLLATLSESAGPVVTE